MRRLTVVASLLVLAGASAAIALQAQRRIDAATAINSAVAQASRIAREGGGERNASDRANADRVRLAEAIALSRANEVDAAERAFSALLRRSDEPDVVHDARFALANLYLRAGLRPEVDPSRARSLIEIAKQRYRDHLLSRPDDAHARWNLERALLAAPEGEEAVDPDTGPPVKSVNVIVPDFAPTDLP